MNNLLRPRNWESGYASGTWIPDLSFISPGMTIGGLVARFA
jgi:hypothetical protein